MGITYRPPPTVKQFMEDDAFVRCIMGPFGSGKSSGCSVELLRRACQQAPFGGIRRTRWAVIRNTYRELADTTIRTFRDWIPESLGEFSVNQNIFRARFNDVEAEFLFRALESPEDVKKLLSLELTGAWINECKEVPRAILEALTGRVGRFPSKVLGGPSWSGILMDTNPCDLDHWLYDLFFQRKPESYSFFNQPGGRTPEAENIENLPADYYKKLALGKTTEWAKVYVDGEFGFVMDGKPIYPEFQHSIHVRPHEDLPVLPRHFPIIVGVDFGLTPAAVVLQTDSDGQVQVLDELVTDDMGAVRFAQRLGLKLRGPDFGEHTVRGYGDPAGMQRSQVDERTPFDVMLANNLPISPAPTNDWQLRREAVARLLTTLTMRGRPALVISDRCQQLVKAMGGGYCFRRLAVGGVGDRYADSPDKNKFSHVAEALQYAAVGEGHSFRGLEGDRTPKKVIRSIYRRQPS